MGYYVMVSLWFASLLCNTRFRSLSLLKNQWTIVFLMFHREKKDDSGRSLSCMNFTDKNKMVATKKKSFYAYSVLNWVFTYTGIQSPGFTNDYQLGESVYKYQKYTFRPKYCSKMTHFEIWFPRKKMITFIFLMKII